MMTRRMDDLLREWADHQEAPQERLDRLADRIGAELARSQHAALPAALPRRSEAFRVRLGFAALGAAVALVVATLFWLSHRPATGPARDASPAALASVSASDMKASVRLVQETGALFPGSLRWIATSESDIQLGLAGREEGADPASPKMLARIVVVRKANGEHRWTSVWKTDILADTEQLVEVGVDSRLGNAVSLWLYPLGDGNVAVDTRVVLSGPVQATCATTEVLQPGRPAQILRLQTNEAEYRVLQLVVKLPGERY